MCTENYFQGPKDCNCYRAIYLESHFTITSGILFFVIVLLSLICTPFSVFYNYDIFQQHQVIFMCGKFNTHYVLHMAHSVAVVC